MKLFPLVHQIDVNDPYKTDVLQNRKEFGQTLENIINNLDERLVLSINADWGEGKTTFIKMWKQSLEKREKKILYYDAF